MAVVLGQYADDVKLQSRQNIYDHSTRTDNVWSWAYEHYEFSDEADVLEVGCGNGVFWDVCGSATEDLSLTLTDISPGMLKAAATKLSMHPKINFELADIQALQFKDASFDTVLAHYMLYHVDDLTVAFSEIKRVLRRNGFLGVLLPDNAHLSTIFEFLSIDDPGHPSHFHAETAQAVLPQHFSNIQHEVYRDLLRIDNADVIIAYIKSLADFDQKPKSFYTYVRCKLNDYLGKNTFFELSINQHLFICTP